MWTEHKAPGGRVYYYNTVLRQSSWEKPDELKTAAEVEYCCCGMAGQRGVSGRDINSGWLLPMPLV